MHKFYATRSTILHVSFSLVDRDELGISITNYILMIVYTTNCEKVTASYVKCQLRIVTKKHEILVPWSNEKKVSFSATWRSASLAEKLCLLNIGLCSVRCEKSFQVGCIDALVIVCYCYCILLYARLLRS